LFTHNGNLRFYFLFLITCTIYGDHYTLSAKARKAIESDSASNFVSIVSLWEIAIKLSLNRLSMKIPFAKLSDELAKNNFQLLPITFNDTMILSTLEFHHRDPFDRLLISQALANDFTLISKDEEFSKYEIKLLW
jgi:PIN domain nuclease of toxin-antitoxin system